MSDPPQGPAFEPPTLPRQIHNSVTKHGAEQTLEKIKTCLDTIITRLFALYIKNGQVWIRCKRKEKEDQIGEDGQLE